MAQRDDMVDVPTPDTQGGGSLKVPVRVFEIIEYLSSGRSVGVSELADQFDIPTSTAQDYLNTLLNSGYLIKNNGKYSLSLKILNIAGKYRSNTKIFTAGRSQVDQLAEKTGETANLGVEQSGQRVKLYDSEGENAIQTDCNVGGFSYMNWSPMGKAMLAAFPDKKVNRIIDRHGLPEATEKTITERSEMLEEIDRIREAGYAIDDEEHKLGLRGIGTAITIEDTVVGAVSVCGPKSRLTNKEVETQYVTELREATEVIGLKYQNVNNLQNSASDVFLNP